tara:strand:+ start:326 stop:493 length:168 start_codon:yes stop_codon:yes gene_type:complete
MALTEDQKLTHPQLMVGEVKYILKALCHARGDHEDYNEEMYRGLVQYLKGLINET